MEVTGLSEVVEVTVVGEAVVMEGAFGGHYEKLRGLSVVKTGMR